MQNKTIKDYTVEELNQILVGTKANILDFTERLQQEGQNRQAIEGELKRREEEPEAVQEEMKKDLKKTK